MDNTHITELVVKTKQGDQNAFSELYDLFADRIYRFIRLKVSETEQAEDILQEVFIKAWQGAKKIEVKDLNFSAWLYRVASNTVNDHYRKSYRRPQTVSIEEFFQVSSPENIEESTDIKFDSEAVRKVVSQLPSNYKQIIELRYFQMFNVDETAKILDRNSVTVRVLQHRAIAKLKRIFKNNEQ